MNLMSFMDFRNHTKVVQNKMRLSQDEKQAKEKKSGIRMVELPDNFCYYYSKQNWVIKKDFYGLEIYLIHVIVEIDKVLTYQLQSQFGTRYTALFLENYLVIYLNNRFIRMNIENYDQRQVFYSPQQDIFKCQQINKHSFMTQVRHNCRLTIYSIRNFKKSHTYLNRLKITSSQYHNLIVQAFSGKDLYYFNTKMTKQIRKYYKSGEDEPIFNSNYLLVPRFNRYEIIIITIYDTQSMRRKGTIMATDRDYISCIFIRELNIIGVLYKTRLELYDFNTLKCIDSERIHDMFCKKLMMKYDEYNGLTIFMK